MKPDVSIIIPVFNGSNYLREAIASALAQTYPYIEVIVVNDGSDDEDRTRAVALSFGERIRYFERPNGGVAAALNLGIGEMRGEYFSWLSHDDIYYPEKISCQLNHLKNIEDDKAISFSGYHVIDHASRVIGQGRVDGALLTNSLMLVPGTYVGGCTLLIPKAAFDTAGVFNESLRNSQDNDLWLRMVMKGFRFEYLPNELIQSRSHAEQGSRTTSTRHAQEAREFYLRALETIAQSNRVENAVGLFRILFAKRQPALAWRLFQMLTADQSLGFALSSIIKSLLAMARSLLIRKLAARPGTAKLVETVKRRRFRSSSYYWQQRYRQGETSGPGSMAGTADYKAEILNQFVKNKGIVKVTEFGCGDGNQLRGFSFGQYLGVDISPAAVEKCGVMFRDDPTKAFLLHEGAATIEAVLEFAPQLTISLDVIYHLVEDSVFEQHICDLFRVSTRYVIIYSTNFDRRHSSPHHVDRRFTDYIDRKIKGWRLVEVLTNPHKGFETQSDFHIYEKSSVAA